MALADPPMLISAAPTVRIAGQSLPLLSNAIQSLRVTEQLGGLSSLELSVFDVLSFAECAANPMALPRLAPEARSMDRVLTLIHTCVHRLMHVTAPYFVDGVTYYGGDRLIWANDIHLLAGALSEAEWARLSALSLGKGVAAVCLDGLTTARHSLGTEIPNWVGEELGSELSEGKASTYLLHSRQFARARQDLLATPGLRRKFAYLRARSLPSPAFIRGKYPAMARMPLALLYARRMIDLLRVRPERSEG